MVTGSAEPVTIQFHVRLRAIPRVGGRVVVSFLATRVGGVVTQVDPDLRHLEVLTDDGDTLRFVLSRASGRFVAEGHSRARLYFDDAGIG